MIIKKVLITGAGSGLGKEAAIMLSKRGHEVIATTQYEKQANELNILARDSNIPITSFKLDINDKNDRELLNEVDFDVLINNAAIGDSGSIADIDVKRIEKVFETNVFSNIKVTQIALKKLIEKKHGRVIFLSSLAGLVSMPFLGPYCSSKYAIEGFASSLRKEMKKLDGVNIGVGIIEPGAYATGFNKENNDKKYEWMYKDSYFKYKWKDIKEKETRFWNLIEKKDFNSIVKQYIKAVEDKKVKFKYTAPIMQALSVQFIQFLGI